MFNAYVKIAQESHSNMLRVSAPLVLSGNKAAGANGWAGRQRRDFKIPRQGDGEGRKDRTARHAWEAERSGLRSTGQRQPTCESHGWWPWRAADQGSQNNIGFSK